MKKEYYFCRVCLSFEGINDLYSMDNMDSRDLSHVTGLYVTQDPLL